MHDFSISVADILGRPGEFRDITISHPISGVQTALARLSEAPVKGELRAESVVEGILVSGRAGGTAELTCARCLKGFSSEIEVEVCELYAAPGHLEDTDEDVYATSGTEVDLEPMLVDALTLALPLNPVHDEACRGLCARCGTDLNISSCDCTDDEIDPRWEALAALRHKLEG